MSSDEAFLTTPVDSLLGATFNVRDGRIVPTTDDVDIKNGAVKI